MSSINLTHSEAIQRSQLLRVHNYSFAIDITGESTFPSKTTVHFEVLEAGSTFIDLLAQDVHHVSIDGVDITETAVPRKDGVYDHTAGIQLNDLTVGEHELVVKATCEYSHTGQGLHRFVDPVDSEVYFYTQFETADAKRVFACFDQPDLKATYDIVVQAPSHWKVVTNAPQLVKADGEKAVFSSRIDYPLSTYLVAICAGDFAVVSDLWSGKLTHHPETPADQPTELEIPLGIYCRKSLAEHLDADTIFRETKQGFDFYHEHFGMAYPFGKYDQLFVPDFNAGAMENAGAVTFRDEYVFTSKNTRYAYERRCDTILHEMAHMWFGDLVTMKWWDDLWLNESFATWGAAISQAEATEYETAWVTFANVEKSWAYQQDQLPSTHPISTDASDIETVEQNFDGITYAKGASVLKQLQAYVGRDAFFAGVRKHFAEHAYGNATFDDLLSALEESSGRDLSHWANQWLKTTGINELACEFEVVDGVYSSFAITQSGATPGAGELRTHRTCVGLYSLIDGVVTRTHSIEVDVDSARTEIPELIGVAAADLVLPNDFDLTYCQMKLDTGSLAFAVKHIDKIADPMARTLCWSAAWEMTRNGEMRARDFIALVARGARFETEIAVLQRILSQATQARKMFADPTWVEETGAQLLLNALLDGARTAEPSSDIQLAFVQELGRNLVDSGESTDAQAPEVTAIQLFKDIVAGAPSLEGLDADNDLRWNALISLAAVDKSFEVEKEIGILSEHDPSSQGKAFAERARAAVNTATNKARVFTELTEHGKELSNTIFRAKMAGLTGFARPELLEQLNERYFEMVLPMWKSFTSEIAQDAIAGLFPRWNISDSTVDRAQRFLDQEDLPGGVRRLISEAQADVIRAVRNRRIDAGACSE
ncbi:aminopeptidase N [Corynebacterium felinum]|uniref:Aminopeptidase N n=1 Tax=Corynebacterium felinum TaxID=131318 RepID=A0ABU2B4T4_9CORY|nr:aminopeptidase N [Corynebacterium felinum]MDF5820861.1 aminopeptidase N [Corynebacterium felinum]MDR7353625.1 aminopeptidase N [Corynebacterium felinum]WJY95804.1 Aminopeptidase N [Corynebacterium felinum]